MGRHAASRGWRLKTAKAEALNANRNEDVGRGPRRRHNADIGAFTEAPSGG